MRYSDSGHRGTSIPRLRRSRRRDEGAEIGHHIFASPVMYHLAYRLDDTSESREELVGQLPE